MSSINIQPIEPVEKPIDVIKPIFTGETTHDFTKDGDTVIAVQETTAIRNEDTYSEQYLRHFATVPKTYTVTVTDETGTVLEQTVTTNPTEVGAIEVRIAVINDAVMPSEPQPMVFE